MGLSEQYPITPDTPGQGERSLTSLASSPLVKSTLLVAALLGMLWLIAPQALDLPQVIRQIGSAAPLWLVASLLAQIIRYLGAGLLMSLSARAAGQPVSAVAASEASLASGAAARLVPFGGAGGIAVRAAFLKRQGVGEAAIAGYFLLQNLLGTAWLIVVCLIALVVLGNGPAGGALSSGPIIPMSLAAAVGAGTVTFLIRRPDSAHRLAGGVGRGLDSLTRRLGRKSTLEGRLPTLLQEVLSALDIGAKVKGGLYLAAVYSSWTILGDIISLYFSGLALGLPASLSETVVAYTAASLAGSAVGLPAGVGITEGVMAATYSAMAYSLEQALSAVLLFRALSFWLPIPMGLLAGWHLRRQHAI